MPQPKPHPWTVEEFFAWQAGQPDRHELVAGFPLRMMAGACNVHDDIVVNLIAELRARLRGRDCRPFTGDGSVRTGPAQVRRPDAGVDCGRRDPEGLSAADPRLVAEVLSPTTRDFDTFGKVAEYQAVPGIAYVLLIEPNAPEVSLLERAEDGTWSEREVAGLDNTIDLPALGIVLAMSELYDGVAFPTGPRLARHET